MSRRAAVRAPAPTPAAVSFPLQRKCCGSKSQGHEDDDARSALGVQSKLTIGRPGDAYEREADAVAERTARADVDGGELPRITPLIQRKSAGGPGGPNASGIESELKSRRGRGSSIPDSTRGPMEERFGVDFSRVRIHADSTAHRLTDELGSLAFTQGSDIYFGAGQYRPGTQEGERLLAHELTHVVQQGGGSGAASPYVQRADDDQESKTYYHTYSPYPLLGARGPISGSGVHEGMQNRLRAANPTLLTEAPISGGTSSEFYDDTDDKWKNFTLLGRADLYMSSMPGHICGIRGFLSDETKEGPRTSATYVYKDRRNTKAKAGKGNVKRSPRMPAKTPPFKGQFPTDIYLADLKPLGITKIAEGIRQIRNYMEGFGNFAEKAKKDGVTEAGDPGAIRGRVLDTAAAGSGSTTGMVVPEGLDYRNVDDPAEDKRENRQRGAFIVGKTRYWLAPMPDYGLYIYFHLNHPHPRDVTADDIREIIEGVDTATGITADGNLRGLRRRLRQPPDPGMPGGIDLQEKRKPGPPPAPPPQREREEEGETTVQRKEYSRQKHDWKKLRKDWERDRDLWKNKKAKPFLESASGEGLDRRNQIDDKLGAARSTPPPARAKILKQVEQISLWSGVTGGLIGKVRFILGDKFDALADFFEKVRKRFKDAHKKAAESKAPGVLGGWKKRLFYLISQAAKKVLGTFFMGLFDRLGMCVGGMIQGMLSEFTDEISESLREKLEKVETYVDEQRKLLEQVLDEHMGKVEAAIEAISTGKQILDIISSAVTGIRLALQLVACLSPPGLGCLWGLVAQLAVSVMLDRVVDTQHFNDKVINPALKKIFGDRLNDAQTKIIASLIPESLEEYAKKSPACGMYEPPPPFIPQVTDGISSEAELRKRRDQWQSATKDEMIRDIQASTHNGEGTSPTREEVLEAAEALKRSGLSTGELQTAADKTPEDSSGRKILDAFVIQVDKTVAQKAPPPAPGAPGQPGQPGPRAPFLSIRKRLILPRRPHIGPTPQGPQVIIPLDKQRQIEIGPKILPPVAPGEEESVGGGATIRF